eukprot:15344723-Ditylum_brightwellii.AAC.1
MEKGVTNCLMPCGCTYPPNQSSFGTLGGGSNESVCCEGVVNSKIVVAWKEISNEIVSGGGNSDDDIV